MKSVVIVFIFQNNRNLSILHILDNIMRFLVKDSLQKSMLHRENYHNISIDRIDSSGDYVIDNIQLVASCVNLMKKK